MSEVDNTQIVEIPDGKLDIKQLDDPAVIKELKERILQGYNLTLAALKCGFSHGTFYKWWKNGEKYQFKAESGESISEAQKRYVLWYKQISPAWADRIHRLQHEIEHAEDSKHAKVLLDLLAKLDPKDYNEKFSLLTKEDREERKELGMDYKEKMELISRLFEPGGLIQLVMQDDRTGRVQQLLRGCLDSSGNNK